MKQSYLIILSLFLGLQQLLAQDFTYDITSMPAVAPSGVTSMDNSPGYGPNITFLAPPPGGEGAQSELSKIKELVAQRFPRKDNLRVETRSLAERPARRRSFPGPNSSMGIPLDTHLAMSNEGQVVAVINFEVAIYDIEVI
jgi:hypothetical protein